MPKLDGTQILSRLQGRLEELERGEEVAARDLRALLTSEQVIKLDAAWEEQKTLRKNKRARTKEEETELGWKSKREIQIDALKNAISEANDEILETLDGLQRKAEIRQARIFMSSYSEAIKQGKSKDVARNLANNNLTRAGLRRLDGQTVSHMNKRDAEIWEMEQEILQKARSEMTAEELEQIELAEEYDKAVLKNRKNYGI
jgi:hypothetical protein